MSRRYATMLLAAVALGSLAGCSLLELGDFGLDTAKTRCTFKAAIPRPNLLKFPG